MAVNFVPTELLLSTNHWLSATELIEPLVSTTIKAALQGDGLLTFALKRAYGEPATVECRRQTDWTDGQPGVGLRRDVLIKAGETPCVAAATLMPPKVIERHSWLTTMGNNPLGEMLEKYVAYQREAFEFKQLEASLIFPASTSTTSRLWARRYRFSLEEGSLLVTEIFFPGVLDRLGTMQDSGLD